MSNILVRIMLLFFTSHFKDKLYNANSGHEKLPQKALSYSI